MAPITDLGALSARPLFEPVAAWLHAFGGDAPPGVAALNAALAGLALLPRAASGAAGRSERGPLRDALRRADREGGRS